MTQDRLARLTVEECVFLDIREFTRKRLFDVGLGLLHALTWTDPESETPRKMLFRVERDVDSEEWRCQSVVPPGKSEEEFQMARAFNERNGWLVTPGVT